MLKYSEIGLGKLLKIDTKTGVCSLQACEVVADVIELYDSEGKISEFNWEQSANAEDDGDRDNESTQLVLPRDLLLCSGGL